MNRSLLVLATTLLLAACSSTPSPTATTAVPSPTVVPSASATGLTAEDRALIGKAAAFLERYGITPSVSAEPRVVTDEPAKGVSPILPVRTVVLTVSSGAASHVSFDAAGRIVGVDGGVTDTSAAAPLSDEAALARLGDVARAAGWDPSDWTYELRVSPNKAGADGKRLPLFSIIVTREIDGRPVFGAGDRFSFDGERNAVILGPDGTLYSFTLTMLEAASAPASLIDETRATAALVGDLGGKAAYQKQEKPVLGYVLPNLVDENGTPALPAKLVLAYCLRYVNPDGTWEGACVAAGDGSLVARGDGRY